MVSLLILCLFKSLAVFRMWPVTTLPCIAKSCITKAEYISRRYKLLSRNARNLAVVRCQKSALHMATSHFYNDKYYRRFRSVYNSTNAVGDFRFVVCNIFMFIRHLVARSHCRDSCACMHRSCRGCNMLFLLLLVYSSSSLAWRYGANSNPGSRHQPN